MPKYTVTVDEVHTCTYSVTANTPQDALERVREGDEDIWFEGEEVQGALESSEWWVSQRDKDSEESVKEWRMNEYGDILWQSQ